MLAISTMVMHAQTYYNCSGIRLFTDGDVAFDFSKPDPLGGFSLTLKDLTSNLDIYSINTCIYYNTNSYTDSISFNSSYSSPITLYGNYGNYFYDITMGHVYCINCSIPNTLEFYRYAHNPYSTIVIKLCAVSSTGEIMGLYNVATIPLSITMHIGQYWYCTVTNCSISEGMCYYDSYGLIPHRIQPTLDFEDLWYTEYDQGNPNWKQHNAFVSEIDHFIIGISFAS